MKSLNSPRHRSLTPSKQEGGTTVKEIRGEIGIAEPTFHKRKAKYGGLEVSDLTRVKELEAELAQYKRIYAELMQVGNLLLRGKL